MADATPEEWKKLKEDDCLMWRMVFLAMVDKYLRKARGCPHIGFGIERPASPNDCKLEVVSWWDTQEWHDLREEFGWSETTFSQKPLGGAATKPTTIAGNLVFFPEDHQVKVQSHPPIQGSWDLARWPPGMMSMVARALLEQVLKRSPKIKVLSWEEHIALGHVPPRRDDRICQETRQQSSPRRKVEHKLSGVLSLDTAGPLKLAYDQGGFMSGYFMVGAFTWAVPCTIEEVTTPEGEEDDEEKGQWPNIEEGEDEQEEGEMGLTDREDAAGEDLLELLRQDEENKDDEPAKGIDDEEKGGGNRAPSHSPESHGRQEQAPPKDFWIEVYRMALPMRNKKSKEVTRTTMELITRLRMDGFYVHQIHADQLVILPIAIDEEPA